MPLREIFFLTNIQQSQYGVKFHSFISVFVTLREILITNQSVLKVCKNRTNAIRNKLYNYFIEQQCLKFKKKQRYTILHLTRWVHLLKTSVRVFFVQ